MAMHVVPPLKHKYRHGLRGLLIVFLFSVVLHTASMHVIHYHLNSHN